MTETPALELQGISHVYVNDKGAYLAVEDIELTVARGEFVSLVGPSGCGKTTLLSLLAGLIRPTLGKVLLRGEAVKGPTSQVGYMLQQDFLFPWRTIADNAAIGLEINGTRSAETMGKVERWLEELGLPDSGRRYPHELSGGMRQRVALARTLVTEPEVLLLDEPFSALDLQIKLQLEALVQDTLRRLDKTAVLVTHDLAEAVAMSDRIVVMGRNPGYIRKQIIVPESVRTASPLDARQLPEYHELFRELWEELEEREEERNGT